MRWIAAAMLVVLLFLTGLRPEAGLAGDSAATQAAKDPAVRGREIRELRWGMFVCWSLSTFSDQEWTPGIEDLSFFSPSGFDPDQWAQTAKDAGMGYILLLTKHHDGFCLWDTQTTERKVTNSPLKKDVVAAVREACQRHGLKLALYYSEGDWTWPGATAGGSGGRNPQIKKAQLKELLTSYGPIEFIWFDNAVGDGGLSHAQTTELVKSLQPDCLAGYNTGTPGDLRIAERGTASPLDDPSGAGAGRRFLAAEFTFPILNQGGRWFYTHPEWDDSVMAPEQIFQHYQAAVKLGNIFSLDVGPDRTGKLRPSDVKTLQAVGRMIRARMGPQDPTR